MGASVSPFQNWGMSGSSLLWFHEVKGDREGGEATGRAHPISKEVGWRGRLDAWEVVRR
jgi:hypothetical protein